MQAKTIGAFAKRVTGNDKQKEPAWIKKRVSFSPSAAPSKSQRPKARPDDGGLDPMKKGGAVKKMASGGMCRGGGAAIRGKSYKG